MDRLTSIMDDGFLWSDATIREQGYEEPAIGMQTIKNRRLSLTLSSHPGLKVGSCVPFYFCYRSVMLYVLFKQSSPSLTYRGGQEPIVHLVAELSATVKWANSEGFRWGFTQSNAGSRYFKDWNHLSDLDKINWDAVNKREWSDPETKEAKQAEFLVEDRFPWHLVIGVGVHNEKVARRVRQMMHGRDHSPRVEVLRRWYY